MLIFFKEEITSRHVFFLNVRSIAFSSPALLLVPVSIFTGKALKGLRVVPYSAGISAFLGVLNS